MPESDNHQSTADLEGAPISLADQDITTVRVDRRSFLSRAVATGSVAVGAVLTTRCGGGADSDSSDSDVEATDSDGTDSGAQATDSDSSDSGAPATDPEATDSDSQ